jgi:S-methylmethionine-dependent homocysteine/selenocysteine methylase
MAAPELALTDGGMETSLIFHDGLELPCFATFPLLEHEKGRATLRAYFAPFLAMAERHAVPFVVGTVTWRANPDWGRRLGYDRSALAAANRRAVAFARELVASSETATISGGLGPRGDGYTIDRRPTADEAQSYHGWQIEVLADAGVDRVTATTMTCSEEAIGVIRAAAAVGVPVVASFTLETDGRLPDGTALSDAVARTDEATGGYADFFMVNCAHPVHIAAGLDHSPSLTRVGGIRLNASRLSHAELDDAVTLDDGDPAALAADALVLRPRLPGIRLLGGCCGTDARHVERLLRSWTAADR